MRGAPAERPTAPRAASTERPATRRAAPADRPARPGAGIGEPAYCRVTLLAPGGRVDVALPVDVPLAELVPMVLELLGEPGPGHGLAPWRLSGATGGPLPPGATLAELRVLDGQLLRVGPQAQPPAAPVFDDPVEALAATVGSEAGVTGDPRLRAGVLVALALAAAALLAGFRSLHPDPAVPGTLVALAVALGVAAAAGCLARAAKLAGRAPSEPADGPGSDRFVAVTVAVAAVPLAAAAGWAALPGGPDAAHVLMAAAVGGTAAALAQAVLRVVAPVLVAAVLTAAVVGVCALLRLRLGIAPGTLAAGSGALALAVGPLLPLAALRLAGLPRPLVPADAGELVRADAGPDLLPPGELAERADLARGYLAGTVAGAAAVAAAAVVPVAATGGWPGQAFAAVTVVVLGLRSRGFADTAPARVLLVGAVAAGLGLAALVAATAGPVVRLLAVAAVVAAVVLAALRWRADRATSPVSRRAVDLLEGLLVAAAVPLALGAMGAYELVRGW